MLLWNLCYEIVDSALMQSPDCSNGKAWLDFPTKTTRRRTAVDLRNAVAVIDGLAARMADQQNLSVAGYENEFVDSIPDTLSCPVCLLPFRDPHLVSCCGAKFCEPCISRVKTAGQPCPVCKQEFISLLDRGDQRKVYRDPKCESECMCSS